MKSRLAVIATGIAALMLGYIAFLRLFPNEADCVATGRVVDPTHRHCEAAGGSYVQLREHVILHTWEALTYAAILAVLVFGGWHVRRRFMRRA